MKADRCWFPTAWLTNAHGEYGDFFALEPGAYRIEFGPSKGYQQQYYDDVLLLSEAQPVIVEAGKTIAWIDNAALQPASATLGEGGPLEDILDLARFPNGTGGTGPVSAPYLGSANEQLIAQVVEREARQQKIKEQEEQKAKESCRQLHRRTGGAHGPKAFKAVAGGNPPA